MFSPRPMCIFFVLYRRVMRFSKGITIIFAANLLLFVALCTGNLVILSVLASRWSVRPLVSRSVGPSHFRKNHFLLNKCHCLLDQCSAISSSTIQRCCHSHGTIHSSEKKSRKSRFTSYTFWSLRINEVIHFFSGTVWDNWAIFWAGETLDNLRQNQHHFCLWRNKFHRGL